MGQSKREIIDIEDWSYDQLEALRDGHINGVLAFEEVECEITDAEGGIIFYRLILQRISDNKYFEFIYAWMEGPGECDFDETVALTQVFPRPTIKYE